MTLVTKRSSGKLSWELFKVRSHSVFMAQREVEAKEDMLFRAVFKHCSTWTHSLHPWVENSISLQFGAISLELINNIS